MKIKGTLASAILVTVASGLTAAFAATEERIAQGDVGKLLAGSTGTFWSVDHNRYYTTRWSQDGSLEVHLPGAGADAEPVTTGKWKVREVEAKEGDDPKEIEARNAALRYVYCHQHEDWNEGNSTCFDLFQVSFDRDGEGEDAKLARTQTYKWYREGKVETAHYVITRR